jgi:hypothetical protein
MYLMNSIFHLGKPEYAPLLTRDQTEKPYLDLEKVISKIDIGGFVLIDLKGVLGFDFSFGSGFFCKTIQALRLNKIEKLIAVANLTDDNRINLTKALESPLGLMMIEKQPHGLKLVGKVHPADQETFTQIAESRNGTTAAEIAKNLKLNLNTANERLAKLVDMKVILRDQDSSEAGRVQYIYRTIN